MVDASRKSGNGVESVTINWKLLDPDKIYRFGRNDFIAAGGDGYSTFEELPVTLNIGELMSDLLMDWIKKDKTISGVEGRITINNIQE